MERVTIKSAAEAILSATYTDKMLEDKRKIIRRAGLPQSGAALVAASLFGKCLAADVSAIKLMVTEIADGGTAAAGPSAFAELTDEQLEAMILNGDGADEDND